MELSQSVASKDLPVQPFKVRQQYTRKDVYGVLGLPETIKGGNRDTGYTSHGPDFFIFCGVGTRGRTGPDYGIILMGAGSSGLGRLDQIRPNR